MNIRSALEAPFKLSSIDLLAAIAVAILAFGLIVGPVVAQDPSPSAQPSAAAAASPEASPSAEVTPQPGDAQREHTAAGEQRHTACLARPWGEPLARAGGLGGDRSLRARTDAGPERLAWP